MKEYIAIFVCMICIGIMGTTYIREVLPTVMVLNPKESYDLPIYSVETNQKMISLTFDTAWENEDINEILEILKKENVKATFFFSGDFINRYPKDVEKIWKAGHDVGNHGENHKRMTELTKEAQEHEIIEAGEKGKAVIGEAMTLFRPPYGDYNKEVIVNARQLGYQVIQWDVDSLDWKNYGPKDIVTRVCEHKELKKGSIVLLHTGTKYTRQALKELIHNLRKKGYEFSPISKMIYQKDFYIDSQGRQRKI